MKLPPLFLTEKHWVTDFGAGLTLLQAAVRFRSLNEVPSSLLWSRRKEIFDGKPLLEHLSPKKRLEVGWQLGFPTEEV